ncbi:hypothetical protein HU200_027070 [Digitaria exilis]|uniref:DUF6598 domain-containing protein n=1 Tax=Digitaria exilis TaxID=1010633 RepID=A0A835C236_9POAL|nr:hypothetical protein HU200_027070 [Digitaria exilis]
MVRRRGLFEYNPKTYSIVPTRFCEFNIAFFDLDKECEYDLDTSMNIVSIKISESDVPCPINIYGTVVARDHVDYRCVYLFKRGRDNPQHIESVGETLTLTGPYRALAGHVLVFEFSLKIIKGDEEALDQEFSKGHLLTLSLESCLSQVKMDFNNIPRALEASIEVNILNEESYFHGKITAGNKKNGIVLYNSKVAGTETKLGCGGSVSLTRRVVAVPWGRDLVLHFSVPMAKPKSISLEHDEEQRIFKLSTYELQIKIIWTGVLKKQQKNLLKKIDRAVVLL